MISCRNLGSDHGQPRIGSWNRIKNSDQNLAYNFVFDQNLAWSRFESASNLCMSHSSWLKPSSP
jgi:hypothetical protein